jgi:phosphate transport system protein
VVRELFQGELERLRADLALMCDLVAEAMRLATRALLDTDLHLSEQVISADDEVDQLSTRCEELTFSLLALQAPVAKDLRMVVTSMRAAEKIERMGDLASHIAVIARLRYPEPAVPDALTAKFAEMGRLGVQACERLRRAITAPTGSDWPTLVAADDKIDKLHREVLDAVSHADPPYPVRIGVDVALLTRYFERFGDQAVSITRRLDYAATGELPDA